MAGPDDDLQPASMAVDGDVLPVACNQVHWQSTTVLFTLSETTYFHSLSTVLT